MSFIQVEFEPTYIVHACTEFLITKRCRHITIATHCFSVQVNNRSSIFVSAILIYIHNNPWMQTALNNETGSWAMTAQTSLLYTYYYTFHISNRRLFKRSKSLNCVSCSDILMMLQLGLKECVTRQVLVLSRGYIGQISSKTESLRSLFFLRFIMRKPHIKLKASEMSTWVLIAEQWKLTNQAQVVQASYFDELN